MRLQFLCLCAALSAASAHIVPGTKWCGKGNNARSLDDVGTFEDTDVCCREHDNCPQQILAGESKYGLNNTGRYTKSHCDCEDTFFKCLKGARSPVAGTIGANYFNLIGPQCFREEFPATDCERMYGVVVRRCKTYELDRTLPKKYQWFDAKIYRLFFH